MNDIAEIDQVRTKPSCGREIVSGVEALARLFALRHALDRRDGLETAAMVSGYPGSPLGGFDLILEAQQTLAQSRVVHRPGVNEELALAVAWGSQMGGVVPYDGVDGVVGAWYGKTPGLDRSGDVLRHANAMGSGPNGGLVLFCGDDPTGKSSTLTCDSQFAFQDQCVPVLYPGDQQELVDFGIHAFRMSRLAGPLVGVKIVTTVADGIGSVDFSTDRFEAAPSFLRVRDREWLHQPTAKLGPHHAPEQEQLIVGDRLEAAKAYVRQTGLDRVIGGADGAARLGMICAGKTYHDVVEALSGLGVTLDRLASRGLRILKLAMTYPLVDETVREFAETVEEIVVIEEKRPFIEAQLRTILHEAAISTPVSGKRDRAGRPLVAQVGELDPRAVTDILLRLMPDLSVPALDAAACAPSLSAMPPPIGRPPAYCSGCPHNRSTVLPEGSLGGGGVGCHGIFYFEPRQAGVNKLLPPPMGAEGVPWIGLAPFVAETHLFQNIGDGTLSHSGILAIRASVAAGVNVTFKILYNAAVAMTGGQAVAGLLDVPALTRELEAEGAARIIVCSAEPEGYGPQPRWGDRTELRGRDGLADAQEELRHVPGVTIIIYDQRCATEARRMRKRGLLDTPARQVFINPAVCEGCGDCLRKSNCASVLPLETEFGERKRIDQSSCNRDYTCLEGDCPSFVTFEAKSGAKASRKQPMPRLPAGDLPDPEVSPIEGVFGVCFTGIGGTGIVTASRLIATAAEREGLSVVGMDQTGLAQKGGAVVSFLKIGRERDALGAASVGPGDASLYLSGDLLQAATPANLARIRGADTVAVVEGALMPTTAMQQGAIAAADLSERAALVLDRLGPGRALVLDARKLAEAALGDAVFANMIMIGAAAQLGGLPFPLARLEEALGSGAGAERNRAAIGVGRWAAHDRTALDAALAQPLAGETRRSVANPFHPSEAATREARAMIDDEAHPLGDLVLRRTAQVIDYQDRRLALRYLEQVKAAIARDDAAHGWQLAQAVIENWFRVLTYKDEYEVARLHGSVDYRQVAKDLGFEGDFTMRYHLHPEWLRSLGLRRKLAFGKSGTALFALLRRMKRLRGTVFDPMGLQSDRKLDRAIIAEYETALRAALASAPYERAVEIAQSVATVRGYGPVKARFATAWRVRLAELTG